MDVTCLLALLMLLSHFITTRREDKTKSGRPYLHEKVGFFTLEQVHECDDGCTRECRITDQQGPSSPLHYGINSGATVVGREGGVREKIGLAEGKLSGSRVVSAFTLDILIEEIPDSIH